MSSDWPLVDLRLLCRAVELTPVREADLDELCAVLPDDVPLDPALRPWPALTAADDRRRLFRQSYWTAVGSWQPESWVLHLAAREGSRLVGVQTLEAERFSVLRTVDSASWLEPSARGRGIGTAMRIAALGLAFDRLGADAAVTSATTDNAASLGVSRRIGYRDNGVGFVTTGSGRAPLQHLRLDAADWRHGAELEAWNVGPCLPWFGVGDPG